MICRFERYVPLINVSIPGDPMVYTIQPKLSGLLEMFLDLYGLTQGKKVCRSTVYILIIL